jgi:hypothetical protein
MTGKAAPATINQALAAVTLLYAQTVIGVDGQPISRRPVLDVGSDRLSKISMASFLRISAYPHWIRSGPVDRP